MIHPPKEMKLLTGNDFDSHQSAPASVGPGKHNRGGSSPECNMFSGGFFFVQGANIEALTNPWRRLGMAPYSATSPPKNGEPS